MKILGLFLVLTSVAIPTNAQWVKQTVDTTASLRGLAVVNEKVIWASGTGGTVIRTIDGGKTWKVLTVPGAEKLDLRDIEAFDANEAYVLSIGSGGNSQILHTTNGGTIWELQFKNTNEKAFFDALACWDRNNCIAMSDPVDDKFVLIRTHDNGFRWKSMDTDKMARTRNGEAAFAASGTCLVTQGKNSLFLVSGGSDARVFRSTNRGLSWFVVETPIVKGSAGSGIFSIAMFDPKNGAVVGGNYEAADAHKNNLAFTSNGGRSWELGDGLSGYRSGVAYIDRKTIVAVGTNGSDITRDGGKTWKKIGNEDLNAVAAKGKRAVWAVGPKGMVVKMK